MSLSSPHAPSLVTASTGEGALLCSKPGFKDGPRLLLTADEVMAVLQEKIAFRFKDVRKSFNFYNQTKDGFIGEQEFRDMLVCIGVDMTEDEYRKLYRRFDRDADGQISYYEWNNVVGNLIYPLSDITLSRPESPNRIKAWTHRALARGFTHMVKPSSAGGSDPVEVAFREVNQSRSGYISHQEFIQLLKRMKVPYGDDEETFCAFKKFQNRKTNPTGQMNLQEFKALVHHYVNLPVQKKMAHEAFIAPKSAEELHTNFTTKVVTKYATVQRAWREMDMDKDNLLNHSELIKNFTLMNIPLTTPELQGEVLKMFDPSNKGHITYQDFSSIIGPIIHPNAKDVSKAMMDIEEASGAQDGLYFNKSARLGGNALDRDKAKRELAADSIKLGDAALPPLPSENIMPAVKNPFRSPKSSRDSFASTEKVELVGFPSSGGVLVKEDAKPAPSSASAPAAAPPALVLAPVSVEALEDRMRKMLGRGWVHAAADIKKSAARGGRSIAPEVLRDVLAEKGVPLTSREVNALASRYSAEGGVNVEGLLTHAFKASFAGAAPPARKEVSASTAKLTASVKAATQQPSAFVKAGSSKVGIF